jgi:molybdopterin-guanine dinucleotide biosynthesis protein A
MAETSAADGPIAGIVLAGGRARRLGGDKALRVLAGEPLLDRITARARPQVAALALSANGDPQLFRRFGLPILPDPVPDFPGPLAGILAGMAWAAAAGIPTLASFACDAPFFPLDLVARLVEARTDQGMVACAASGGRRHPVFAVWPVSLEAALRRALTVDGVRRVDAWARAQGLVTVPFPDAPQDPFFNINTAGDLAAAETLLAGATRADNGGAGQKG